MYYIIKCKMIIKLQRREVVLLKQFRDAVLTKTDEGRQLIEIYYKWSPWIADALKQSQELKEEIKDIIDELIPLAKTTVE